MSEILSPGIVSRRTFLRASVATVSTGVLSRLSRDAFPDEYATLIRRLQRLPVYETPIEDPSPVFDFNGPSPARTYTQRDKLVVATNPRLGKITPTPGSNVAYAVTHPGFAEASISDAVHSLRKAQKSPADKPWDEDMRFFASLAANVSEGRAGNYDAYRGNLMRLFDFLGKQTVPTLCFYEYTALERPELLRPEFQLPENAFALSTEFADGALMEEVAVADLTASNGYESEAQQPELLFDAWKNAGITEVHVAGEYSFNFGDGSPACLHETTQTLMEAGFTVRGIAGAIYPPQAPQHMRNTEVAQALFGDSAVSLDR